MHFIEVGDGTPTILCVHGFCQSSRFWSATLDSVADQGARGFAVDLPGFAGSAHLPGPYTMEAFADAVAAFLDQQSIDRVTVVGGSMGGVVAQHFALRHPSRLARLLLVATGAYTADPDAALNKANDVEGKPWNADAARPIVHGFFHRPPPYIDELIEQACAARHEAVVQAARSNARSNTLARLNNISVPTLVIQGRHDKARTVAHGEEMRTQIAGARLQVLEGSGHTPQLEEPDAFHRLAVPFLLARS